jgi:Ca-activated chloride channel homolog
VRGARAVLIAAALAAIIVAAVASLRGGGGGKDNGTTAVSGGKPSKNAIRIVFAFSPEKEEMMKSLIPRFDKEHHQAQGRPVFVEGQKWSSGAAEAKIAKGQFQPQAWSPSSSLWGRLLNFQADRAYVADRNPSLVQTPLVIAMWEPLARALGWPRKPIGFATILSLATSHRGWAAYGKPTFGQFKLGHTNPDFSTSGLSFVAAQYYTAAGKREGLTEADVSRPAIRAKVRKIEQSIVHYGDTTLFFADQLKLHGPGYASAVALEEATLLDYNKTRPQGSLKLVAIYPSDGTFVSDNPVLVLNAPWVSAAERAGAQAFSDWITKELTPEIAAKYGFRPGDPTKPALPPVEKANGVDPNEPTRILALPEPRVLAKIKQAWHVDRKAANVMLVVDVSGSMGEAHKLEQAKGGLRAFLRQLSPHDRVGLLFFNDKSEVGVPLAPFATTRRRLSSTVNDLFAGGGTALYDATDDAWTRIDALRDNTRINAVVVLSDGADTASGETLDQVVSKLRARSGTEEGRQIRIFTIAYGSQANEAVLKQLAEASGGQEYTGDPKDVEAVYLQISSFF